MTSKYSNEEDIEALISKFESGTIERSEWRHAEHLVAALYYLTRLDVEAATKKMREGIFNLLKAFKVDLTKEMPYHETLTVFWMRTVAEFNEGRNGATLVEKANELVSLFDKDYPLRFYSREYLFSDEARARFVEPDLAEAAAQAEVK